MKISSLSALSTDSVDLWFIKPDLLSTQHAQTLQKILSPIEAEHLLQFKNKNAQFVNLITRAISRLILSKYTDTEAEKLSFVRTSLGKPSLEANKNSISFNLSHNNQLIVMAVCVNDNIGCDIENPARKVNITSITRRYFSNEERNEITQLGEIQQRQRFFQYWTLKEAFVKATGKGISLGLDSFYFTQQGDEKKINLCFKNNYTLDKTANWQCYQSDFLAQSLAICRETHHIQSINFIDAMELITPL